MIKNLDNQSKKTRESLRHSMLTKSKIKELLNDTESIIIWGYNANTDLYTKITATLENNKVVLKNPSKEVLKDEEIIFETKKMVLAYQRAPEKKTTTKKNLLRDALGPKELGALLENKTSEKVWGFNEVTQDYKEYTVMVEKGEIVIKDENGEIERFIDAIFKTESEIKKYQKALFM